MVPKVPLKLHVMQVMGPPQTAPCAIPIHDPAVTETATSPSSTVRSGMQAEHT